MKRTLFDIFLIANIKKMTTTRGRRACSSTVITGSPYKAELVEQHKAKEIKTAKQQSRGQGRKVSRGRGHRSEPVKSSEKGKAAVKNRLNFKKET